MTAAVYLSYSQEDLDRAYDQRAWAANAGELIAQYASASADVRSRQAHCADIKYGPGTDERLDWFDAGQTGGPIHIHLHGGAWRALSKADVSFAAPAFTEQGIAFLAPDFTNLPAVRIPEMIDQLVRAVSFVYKNASSFGGDPDRIFISGHSSGAHLCAVLLARDWTRDGLPADVLKAGLCIAGIYDLEPVMLSSRRAYVDLTPGETFSLSPARHPRSIRCPLTIAYGERESPEFARQAASFAEALRASGNPAQLIALPGKNHFEIALDLGRPGSAIFEAAMAQITGCSGITQLANH